MSKNIEETTKYILDTNILVLAVTKNKKQAAALDLLQQHNAYITTKSLLELIAVLSKPSFSYTKVDIKNITTQLETIFEFKILAEKHDTYTTALELFHISNKTKKWLIFDCQLAAMALHHDITTIYTQNRNDFDWLPILKIKSLD